MYTKPIHPVYNFVMLPSNSKNLKALGDGSKKLLKKSMNNSPIQSKNKDAANLLY